MPVSAASPQPSGKLRKRLVEAAVACFCDYGIRKTSLTDVAQRAGVSRTSTYRTFQDKDGLVAAVVHVEAEAFVDALDESVDWSAPLPDALASAVSFSLQYLQNHTLLQRLITLEPDQLTTVVINKPGETSLVEMLLPAVVQRFVHTHTEVLRVPVDQAAEWLIRMTISMLMNPVTRLPDPRRVAELLVQGLVSPGEAASAEVTPWQARASTGHATAHGIREQSSPRKQ
jgi:AcrR family transcriptional regulator